VIQYCGKDNLRQQSAIWQGMLLAANLPSTTNIIIDGFIISGGQKMSKSIGNVINPFYVIDMFKDATDYPEDVLRFILLHEVPSFEDGDITIESIKIAYTAYLANGIGNLTNRIMKMAITNNVTAATSVACDVEGLATFDIRQAISSLMFKVHALDKMIQDEEAFKVVKSDMDAGKLLIAKYVAHLDGIAKSLAVFLPRTSAKILECIVENKMPEKPLFNRLA
jgi:methionyl-tRNA synthetase